MNHTPQDRHGVRATAARDRLRRRSPRRRAAADSVSKTSTTTSATDGVTGPAAHGWLLHALAGPDVRLTGTSLQLSEGASLLGRAPVAAAGQRAVAIFDKAMSRSHVQCTVTAGAREFWVQDQQSRNGTWLDGKPAAELLKARHGSVLRLGDSVFVLEAGARQWHAFDRASRGMPGLSLEARRMRSEVAAAADTPEPVLVTGAAGTGKQRTASEIHALSRRLGKLVRIDVATLSPSGAEAALFGSAAGTARSTGESQLGAFRQANTGTLVLDDVASLALPLQRILLRVLQTGVVRGVGEASDTPIRVKLIACTSARLDSCVAEGTFIAELAARLSKQSVMLAPTARRTADLLALMDVTAAPLCAAGWSQTFALTALESLLLYDWPGNERELARVLQALRGVPPPIPNQALPTALLAAARGTVAPVASPLMDSDLDQTAPTPRAEELRRLLARFNGSVDAAAKALGRDRKHLDAWLHVAGIDTKDRQG